VRAQGVINVVHVTLLFANARTANWHKMVKIALPGKESYSPRLDSGFSVM